MIDLSPILFLLQPWDMNYTKFLKPFVGARKASVIEQTPDTIAEIENYCKSIGCKYIITTNVQVLNRLVQLPAHQSIDDWQGSLYEKNGITYLFINPLEQFFTVPYGKFVLERFITKITKPETWPKSPEFTWELLTVETVEKWYDIYSGQAIIIAEDIETKTFTAPEVGPTGEEELLTAIRCVTYSALFPDGRIHNVVIPILEASGRDLQAYWVTWMRKFNALVISKIMQNGNYDNFHFTCYAAPVTRYLWDTQSLFHSWYCELPKRLDFIAAFTIHNVYYWKDMGSYGGQQNLFEYNARDGWATLVAWMNLIKEMPDWAIKNYILKFPVFVPCLTCNLEGQRIDDATRKQLIDKYTKEFESIRNVLGRWFGPGFNPRSPQQVVKLIQFYGSPDISSSSESELKRFALRHPLNARFARAILDSREASTIISKYLKPQNYSVSIKPSKKKPYLLQHGRLFYSLNPDGTDTLRLSCSEGDNWSGSQIQNWPVEAADIKTMCLPDEGWEDFEIDMEQSEARDVAYLSGDSNLIQTVESGRDYHAVNAERFFGIPYDKIVVWDEEKLEWKTINKKLRNLSKRTNHGANYNMGATVLLQTMGEQAVDEAKKLLGLPTYWTRINVCEHLLKCYSDAYPTVKGAYYQAIIAKVMSTQKLVSPLGWTRYCFGNPKMNKQDLNAYVAHPSQNLSVSIINESFKEIYWKIQNKHPNLFRLKAQIHDSIKGQVRIGHRFLIEEARKLCIRPVQVADYPTGKVRTLITPVAVKIGPNWGAMESWKYKPTEETSEKRNV